METLPTQFEDAVPPAERADVQHWWQSLSEDTQRELIDSLDSHWDHSRFIKAGKRGSTRWRRIPVRLQARFVDAVDDEPTVWHSDFYDYLVNHEIYHVDLERMVHICTRHPLAAAAVRAGRISSQFQCPLADGNCPLRRLLAEADGRSIRLEAASRARAKE